MKELVAQELLKIKAVFLRPNEPFIWSSGIKSPIYCDNRLTLSYPETRELIKHALSKKVIEEYPNVEYIMGTATAGIAHAALVADQLNMPMGYVRSTNKDHGRNNIIEGAIIKGAKTVVIEDLISTGGSSVEVAKALKEQGFHVLGVVAIFSYQLAKGFAVFEENRLEYHTVTDYDVLIEEALRGNYISEEDLKKLKEWKKDPYDETWIDI